VFHWETVRKIIVATRVTRYTRYILAHE